MFVVGIIKEIARLFLEMAPYIMLGLFFVGALNLLFSKELVVRHVGKNTFGSVLKASLLGVPLPLCSCGVIPTSVYMAKNGASKGSVVSFLISTPQTGIDSMVATFGMMGWLFGIFRPIAAFAMGLIGGTVIKLMDITKQPEIKADVLPNNDKGFIELSSREVNVFVKHQKIKENIPTNAQGKSSIISFPKGNIIKKMYNYAFVEFLDDISVQFIVGLIISGLIAYLVPDSFFESSTVNSGIVGMLIMILVGVPMYVCATASIPIAVTLMMKGFSPGVAFVFLVVGPVTNAASFTIIMNVLGKKIALSYLITVSILAIIFGYLLDGIISAFDINIHTQMQHLHEHTTIGGIWLQYTVGILFFILLAMSLYRKLLRNKLIKFTSKSSDTTASLEYSMSANNSTVAHSEFNKYNGLQKINIEGMTCNHCVMNVRQAISEVEGVQSVDVVLSDKAAYVGGKFDFSSVQKNVEAIGYKVVRST